MSIKRNIQAAALRRVYDFVDKDPEYPLCVMYTEERGEAEKFAEILRKLKISVPDSRIVNVGAAIGSHIGAGSVGVAYAVKT